ncbi:MAG: hypothetical protein U0324_21365 [Polyangiales bacterium]
MKRRTSVSRFGLTVLTGALALGMASCATDTGDSGDLDATDPDAITGANAVARKVTVESYVYVRVGATNDEVQRAAVAQIRPLFGALKAHDIGLGRRLDTSDAYRSIDATTFRRDTVNVINPTQPGTTVRQLDRVRFTYSDTATVVNSRASMRAFPTTILFNEPGSHANDIVQQCQSEHQDWGSSGIWYNFEPHLTSCQTLITGEKDRIETQRRALANPDREVTVDEAARWFLPLTLRFTTIRRTENKSPDYHRLFDDNKLSIHSYFGEDKHDDANDYGAKNFFTYVRTVLRARPELRVTSSAPTADLSRITFAGQTITYTPADAANWVVDRTGIPSQVPSAMRDAFRLEVIRQWRDKLITLSTPATVSINGRSQSVVLAVNVFYGNEESFGSGAVQRYQRAFQEADVFQYTGHSHLGSGPLDARNYSASNFPDRYQVLMVNSCVSFNYYNRFFDMHPGGTRNLDTVTNGLPVFLEGSGESSARFAVAFLDGQFRNYLQILTAMKIDLPWERGHDANRVADGETDNVFTPTAYRMTLTVPQR